MGCDRRIVMRVVGLVIGAMLLAACEAPLNLNAVEWQRSQNVLRFDMYQALARDGDRVVAVSSTGAVLLSSDRGYTWSRTELKGNPTLIDVEKCPNGDFVALDTRRELWTLSGDEWSAQPIDTMESVLALTCDSRDRVWVTASFSTLLTSSDRGTTWEMKSFDEDLQFTTIQFVDDNWGVISGEFGTVMTTADGGENWDFAEYIPNEFYPMAAVFTDRQTGWIAGLNGITWRTQDGGASWQRHDAPKPSPLYGITATNGRVYTVGESGAVFSWDGTAWKPASGTQMMLSYLRAVEVLDDSTILVAGGNGAIMRITADRSVAMVN